VSAEDRKGQERKGQERKPAAPAGNRGRSARPTPEAASTLSALEEALKQALASVPRDQVVKCIAAALPTQAFLDQSARLHESKVRKVSVSMPEELADAVRARTGTGGFSRYVTDAVSREIRHDLLGELLDELDAEYGPVPEDLIEQARRQWPDHDQS
jgi:Arc/MetJ-type ribon-helix-helix transcriptional regulator